MLGPQRFVPDFERLLAERFGFVVCADDSIQLRQVIEANGSVGVLGPQRLSADLESLLVERFGLFVCAHLQIETR